MLKKKQVFLAAQEELKLELAIAKTQAREKAYAEFMEEQNRQTADEFKHPYELPSPSAAPPLAITSAPPALPTLGNFSLESSECDHHDLPRPPGAAVPLLYPTPPQPHFIQLTLDARVKLTIASVLATYYETSRTPIPLFSANKQLERY